jgi:5-oxopent-3-ene-1,2,5-tricarboxylate decarboxylase/2-hydroxyhepta-2,4-diene-1,7-dioate isomerase
MKRARILERGRALEVHVREPGVLVDASGHVFDEASASFLLPVEPTKVVAIALNYSEHASELQMAEPEEPALFFKSPNTWTAHRQPVLRPRGARYMHYEVELAVVIGRRCRRVAASRALDFVRGYTIANDLVLRDHVTNLFRPPLRGKCRDTFCPIGPYLVEGEIAEPHMLGLRAFVNGELRQSGTTSGMVHRVPELIEFVSDFMTLEAGDLLLTGTPRGVSHVYAGDLMRLEIDGLGALENPVVEDSA